MNFQSSNLFILFLSLISAIVIGILLPWTSDPSHSIQSSLKIDTVDTFTINWRDPKQGVSFPVSDVEINQKPFPTKTKKDLFQDFFAHSKIETMQSPQQKVLQENKRLAFLNLFFFRFLILIFPIINSFLPFTRPLVNIILWFSLQITYGFSFLMALPIM